MPTPTVDTSKLKYFKLQWTGLVSKLDGVDADDLPDLDAVTGVITVRPNLKGPLKFMGYSPSFTLFPMKRTINLGDGQFNDQSRKYVMLEAATTNAAPPSWTWQAVFDLSYQGVALDIPSFSFMGLPGGTIDFSDEIPITDAISGIAYMKGDRGVGVGSVAISGANLSFFDNTPGQNLLGTVILPGGFAIPDADATTKGKLKLAGDLAGTADAPTVPALQTLAQGLSQRPTATAVQNAIDSLQADINTRATATQLSSGLNGKIDKADRAQPSGIATLGTDGKLTPAQAPLIAASNDPRVGMGAIDIGDGVTAGPYSWTHNLNTRDIYITVYRKNSPFEEIRLIDVRHPTPNQIQIYTDKPLPVCRMFAIASIGTSDVTPPTKPALTLVSKTATSVTISASTTDAGGISGYNWFNAGAYVSSTGTNQYTFTGLNPSTTYSFSANAGDGSSNVSEYSDALSVTTNAPPAPPTFDASSSSAGNGNRAWNIITGASGAAGSKTVYAALTHLNGAAGTPNPVTCGGTAMNFIGSFPISGSNGCIYLFALSGLNPSTTYAISMPTAENYSVGLALSYTGVVTTGAIITATGNSASPSTGAVTVGASETLMSIFQTRNSPTLASGTARVSNSSGGFNFTNAIEGSGASPQTNSETQTSIQWGVLSVKIASV